MKAILYASTATRDMSPDDLRSILATSRSRNLDDGITGLLLCRSGRFFQLIEGAPEVVDATMARIEQDPRHSDVRPLLTYAIEDRQFPEWTMGFDAVSDETAAQLPGYRDSLNDIFNAPADVYGTMLPALRELVRWYQIRPE